MPYDVEDDPALYGPALPEELRGRIDFGGAAPLPGGTANADMAARGYQSVPQTDVNYSEADRRLIRMNEDDRLVALGINPVAYRRVQADAEEQAVRFQGQNQYNALVAAGKSPEEALRATAGLLFHNHPDKLAQAIDRIPGENPNPASIQAVPILGEGGTPVGNAVYDRGRLHASSFQDPLKPTAQEVATKSLMRDEIRADRAQLAALNRAKMDVTKSALIPDLDQQITALTRKISDATAAYSGSKATAPEKSAPIPFKEGTVVRNRRTGKLYKITNGEPVEQ